MILRHPVPHLQPRVQTSADMYMYTFVYVYAYIQKKKIVVWDRSSDFLLEMAAHIFHVGVEGS